jgi:hypothetical protein
MTISPNVMTSCNCMEILFYDDMHEHVVMKMMFYSRDDMEELECGLSFRW